MKHIIKLLPLAALLFTASVHAEKTIQLEDNAQIIGNWEIYAETAALHKEKKQVKNTWQFGDDGILSAIAFDPRLNADAAVKVKYLIENGAIKKQIQPGREQYETCKVIKLEGDDMTLHCKYLYYLLKRK
ncbi:MAG: hypothetical protein K9L22_05140 [Methylococcaceae bacterium]|nr:hypothetical protein [Methylococcaceae bacterium]